MLGRALCAIDNSEPTDRIAAEVQAELDAVEQAELGDLSGRAQQAVELTRQDVSPVQVVAASQLLNSDPLGNAKLSSNVDPAAAAVAAAHWLQAAADVAADESGMAPTQIMHTADDIEALPWTTPPSCWSS